jgi:hypothetical protein
MGPSRNDSEELISRISYHPSLPGLIRQSMVSGNHIIRSSGSRPPTFIMDARVKPAHDADTF